MVDHAQKNDDNLEEVVNVMSAPNPDVTDREPDPEPEEGLAPEINKDQEFEAVTDKYGRAFDPAIHVVDTNGRPRINSKNGYLSIKAGTPPPLQYERATKAETRAEAANEKSSTSVEPDIENKAARAKRRYVASVATSIFIKTGVGLFGEEWLPKKERGIDEQAELVDLWDEYLKAKGLEDLPPGVALALGLGGYAAMRLHLPQTRSRFPVIISKAGHAAGAVFIAAAGGIKKTWGFFASLFRRNKKNASHFNMRHDGIGQDNSREKTSENIPTSKDAGPGPGSVPVR